MPDARAVSFVDLLESHPLPELAAAVRSRTDEIMTRWERSACRVLPKAHDLTFKQLRDESRTILHQLADALASNSPAATDVMIEASRQHAGVRFDEEYDLRELIIEYRLLRRIIVEEVESVLRRCMTLAEQITLQMGVDTMLQRGVLAFVEYQQKRLLAAKQSAEKAKAVAEEATAAAEQSKGIAEAASHAKNEFLAVLSHELRNPLNPVLATACLLHDDPRFDPDTHEQLDVICRNAELAAQLIDDLLDITRIERGKIELHRQPVALCTIMRHAAEVCRPDIEAAKVHFGMDIQDGPSLVNGDPARLQQVFWNLLKNAVKFTPPGGCVGLRCGRRDGHVVAEVNDSGEGIGPELLPHLFDAFEQGGRLVTRQFGGLGLGLTIAKAMVELHGGTISAKSQGKGRGATFTVRLPLLLPAAAVVGALSPATTPAPVHPLRILLVEDQGDTARIMRRVLSAKGHEVLIAADVTTALQMAAEQTFDLLLSDLGLPDGSGLDLMRSLRQRGLTLPGIALSGYGQDTDLQASREAGFAAHLVKPVNMTRLQETIAATTHP